MRDMAAKTADIIELPKGAALNGLPLATALRLRRSVREFTAGELTWVEISELLRAAQGVTEAPAGLRAAPSAGALYPLELDAATRSGIYRYRPDCHAVAHRERHDVRAGLARAALDQAFVGSAPCVFAISAVLARTAHKYGARAQRYVHLEAGHVAQNLLLAACALGLAGTPVGAFADHQVASVLRLDAREQPLYLIPIGRA